MKSTNLEGELVYMNETMQKFGWNMYVGYGY